MTASTAIAITAANQASQAKKQVCRDATIPNFNNTTATIEQRQQFADCVRLMHPDQMTGGEVLLAKIFIVAALIGVCLGIWAGKRDGHMSPVDWIAYSMGGAFLVPVAIGFVGLLIYGILYLFWGGA